MANLEIFYALNSLVGRSNALDTLIIFCAVFLGWWLLFGAFVYLAVKPPSGGFTALIRRLAIIFGGAAIAYGLAEVIKYFFPSPRPFLVLEKVNLLFQHGGFDSFPSAHAAIFFALATGVWFLNKKLGLIFFLGAILISLARVSAGIHWPSDILAGAGLGLVAGLLFMSRLFKQG